MGTRVLRGLTIAALMATAVLSATQPESAAATPSCITCRAVETRTMVSFSPVISANRLMFEDISVLDPQGQPLNGSLYQLIPPTNAVDAAFANGPVLLVDSKTGFRIGLNGNSVLASQPFTITVVRGGSTRSVSIEDLNPELSGQIMIDAVGALNFRGVPLRQVRITQTYETSGSSYRFTGIRSDSAADRSLALRTYDASTRVVFRDTHGVASVWSLYLRSSTRTSTARFHATRVKVPRGDQLVVVYGSWHGSDGRPALWLDRHSDGRLDQRLTIEKG